MHPLARSGSDVAVTHPVLKTAAICCLSLLLTDTIFSNMCARHLVLTRRSAWPLKILCMPLTRRRDLLYIREWSHLTKSREGRNSHGCPAQGRDCHFILARPGGTEELLNWLHYRVVVVYLSRTYCFWLETSLTLRKMSCALASGPQQTEWLEERKKWSSSPKPCARSWRSNSGRLYLTGSAESQPESSSKGTWMRAVHPLLPKVFCCIFIRKVSKNFFWCVLNGSYLLTL